MERNASGVIHCSCVIIFSESHWRRHFGWREASQNCEVKSTEKVAVCQTWSKLDVAEDAFPRVRKSELREELFATSIQRVTRNGFLTLKTKTIKTFSLVGRRRSQVKRQWPLVLLYGRPIWFLVLNGYYFYVKLSVCNKPSLLLRDPA